MPRLAGRLDGDEGFAEVFLDDVFIPDDDEQSYTHIATAGNISGNYTIFDSAGIDQSQPHRVFVTQRYLTTYNDAWVGTA